MALYPSRTGDTDEATKELLRRLLIGQPDKPRRFIDPTAQPNPSVVAPIVDDRPTRIPVDANAPPPNPNWAMEQAYQNAPVKDVSQMTVKPELGIDYFNRTGKQRLATEQPSMVESGVKYESQAPRLPPIRRMPEITGGAIHDSTVMPPESAATGLNDKPTRINPGVRDVARNPNESDADYAARKHHVFQDELRTDSPYSKVTETPTGVDVTAPVKPRGMKARAMAGLMLALATMGSGAKGGPAAEGGAALTGLLTGMLAPSLQKKIERSQQIDAAGDESKVLDQQQTQELLSAERQARTADLKDMPQRRADAAREKRIADRERNWERLVNSPEGFDPGHNAEHRKIQLEAANEGQILPSVPPKAVKGGAGPHLSTRIVRAGEYPGVKAGSKIRQIWNGQTFEDDVQNGRPVVEAPAPDKPVTPDIRSDLQSKTGALKTDIDSQQAEWARHNEYIKRKDREWQEKAVALQKAARKADPMGMKPESKRALKDWVDQVKSDDPDYAGGGYDTSVSSRDWLGKELNDKKGQLKETQRQLEQEDRRPRTKGAYAGRTFTADQVSQWAASQKISVSDAKQRLEKEGALVR